MVTGALLAVSLGEWLLLSLEKHCIGYIIFPTKDNQEGVKMRNLNSMENIKQDLGEFIALNVKSSSGASDEKEMFATFHYHLQSTCAGYPVTD